MATINYLDNKDVSIREIDKDERWLQDWIVNNPEKLGLGEIEIVEKELIQYQNYGGRLDILAHNSQTNTYFEIEVMLGECDSDHGFRTLDYWARERLKNPNSLHYAVLVAEDLQGRYKTLIETLPQFIPFIAIEIRTLLLEADNDIKYATCKAEIVAQPDELVMKNEYGIRISQPRDEDWWRQKGGEKFVSTIKEFNDYCNSKVGKSRIDFTANSYVSLKKHNRIWMPLWARQDGFRVNVADDGTGTKEQPSERYYAWKDKLEKIGIELFWIVSPNPMCFNLTPDNMKNLTILELLKESYNLVK
jgi:hypothetical protein